MRQTGACQRCGTANVAAARFCMACGASLVAVCSTCGTTIEYGARYCIGCGASLEREHASGDPGEERRTVSVLFADLVGYTTLSESLDHESVKLLTDRCLTRLAREVERFGGYVDQYIGDNVMAVFGAPTAHEDDPERAVRAGWGMQRAMEELNTSVGAEFGVELALRVGVNTGEALAGRVGGQYTVVGDVVNTAARLQTSAPVGGLLIGERTRRSAAAAARFREVGPLALKGKAEPVRAYEVVEILEPARHESLPGSRPPLIGRGTELQRLRTLFAEVDSSRRPHTVTVIGEAGVGKTRIVEELRADLERVTPGLRVLAGSCHPFGAGSYAGLVDLLRVESGLAPGDDAESVRDKLQRTFAPGQPDGRFDGLAALLGGGQADEPSMPSERDQREAREAILAAARGLVEQLAGGRPLLIVWEDVHWADEGTLELIEHLGRWLDAPVLQVCVARDDLLDERPGWGSRRESASTIFVEPLSFAHTRTLIGELASRRATPIEIPETLAARSGGNALFAEALVDSFVDAGGVGGTKLPETLQGLLAARLDALPARERRLLGHAAVAGAAFAESMLETLGDEESVRPGLDQLCARNLISPAESDDPTGGRVYAFRHVLIREAAYESLPLAVRAEKHAEIGALVERREGERASSLLAEHFVRAATFAERAHLPRSARGELRAKALAYSEAAGNAAVAVYTNEDALAHYRTAATLAEPGGEQALRIAERIGELELRLGMAEAAVESWRPAAAARLERGERGRAALLHGRIAAAELHRGEIAEAMLALREGIGLLEDEPASLELIRLYEEAAALYDRLGNDVLGIYACERALRLAEELEMPAVTTRALAVLGRLLARMGDGERARERLDRAVALSRGGTPSDEVLALLALGSSREENDGDYAGAEAAYREALAIAERIGDVPAQIEIRTALARISFYRCDWSGADRECGAGSALAEREGLAGGLCLTHSLKGRLRWRQGDWGDSERFFDIARELAERAGRAEVCNAALLGHAATRRDSGDLDGAESTLLEAVAVCERGALIAPSIQTHAALALARSLAGRSAEAERSADEAARLARRVHDPAARLITIEARGFTARAGEALEALEQARLGWGRLGRPLEQASCEMWIGRRLLSEEPERAGEALRSAAASFDRLGVAHLAARSRELAPA